MNAPKCAIMCNDKTIHILSKTKQHCCSKQPAVVATITTISDDSNSKENRTNYDRIHTVGRSENFNKQA